MQPRRLVCWSPAHVATTTLVLATLQLFAPAHIAISTSEPKETTPVTNETLHNQQQLVAPTTAQPVQRVALRQHQPAEFTPQRTKPQPTQSQPASLSRQQNGRARKSSHQQQQLKATTTTAKPSEATASVDPSSPSTSSTFEPPFDLAQEEIRRMMDYSNTPPLFVTTTRDFFVDVARYPLGSKLTTVQAIDSDGDRIEYSLQPANDRDASPYFAINATSGELRLANKRFQLSIGEQQSQAKLSSVDGDDESDDIDADQQTESSSSSVSANDQSIERPGYLYFLNVAANDGHYLTVVELQIHVFNSSSFGTNSAVQLTTDGSFSNAERIENLIRSKSIKFFDELSKTGPPSLSQAVRQNSVNNSTVVYPNFVNPSLTRPLNQDLRSSFSLEQRTTAPMRPASKVAAASDERRQHLAAPYATLESQSQPSSSMSLDQQQTTDSGLWQQQQQQQQMGRQDESKFVAAQDQQTIEQQQLMMSLAFVFCSFVAIAVVLLLFIVPISVNRLLRRRLKTAEMEHDQLSHRNSTNCSSSTAGSMMTSNSVGPENSLPSLSQFTFSDSSSGHNRGSSIVCRQSSLDSALTGGCATISSSTMYNQNSAHHFQDIHSQHFNLPPNLLCKNQHMDNSYLFKQQQQLANGLNRVNNGLIANPLYLHQQSSQFNHGHDHSRPALPAIIRRPGNQYMPDATSRQLAQQQRQANSATEIIYYPLDDEFYSTINVDGPNTDGDDKAQPTVEQQLVGSLVGQTSNSKGYLESQCAQPHNAILMSNLNDQQHLIRDSGSPESTRSSTRSLSRFLSLPARHWSHQQEQQRLASRGVKDSELLANSFGHETLHHHLKSDLTEVSNFKTIARGSQVEREKQSKHKQKQTEEQHKWEIQRHRVKFLNILDEGQFGFVWRCKLKAATNAADADGGKPAKTISRQKSLERIAMEQEELTVAVKTLKKSAARGEREREELLAEIDIMKLVCNHPNVVKILHCCTSDLNESNPILLVMEYVELGKLQSFLEKSRMNHTYATTAATFGGNGGHNGDQQQQQQQQQQQDCEFASVPATPTPSTPSYDNHLTSRDLIKFIYHVAKGMEYISSNFIVHRDLASRNILVDSQLICKIGDFGMARHMRSSGDIYERHSSNSKIPVRWMAPEVLRENSFTTKSDVFSFGILMWEIVTLGSTPYRHLRTEQVIDAVALEGERPSKPEYCHSQLYEIMSKCWSHRPDDRPTFGMLVQQLDELLLSANEYIELDQYPDHQYCNIPRQFIAPNELV